MRWLLLVFGVACFPAVAWGDESDRAAIETAFLEGRLDDIDVLVVDEDPWTQYALFVRDAYWRRGPAKPVGGDDLLNRRVQWVRDREAGRAGPFPTDAEDPMPILTAMIQEREMREGLGAGDVARIASSPLRALALSERDGEAVDEGLNLMTVHQRFEPSHDDRASESRAESLASRNAWLGLGAVLLLVIATVLLGTRLAPKQPDDENSAST